MIDFIITKIESIMNTAKEIYNVDPIIFLVIYFICVPVFYFSLYKTIRSIAQKNTKSTLLWSTVFLASCVAPFLYVMIFGRNIPWWVYIIIVILIGQSVYSIINRIKKKPDIKKDN